MKKFGRIILTVLALGVLTAWSIPSRPTPVDPKVTKVTVVNTPLPIQGSVSVNNFPAAQAVSGTVNVGNFPATQNVNVSNPATAPFFVVNVDDPGQIPYQSSLPGVCVDFRCEGLFPAVPSGHRLVIQHFSGSVSTTLNSAGDLKLVDAFLEDPASTIVSIFPVAISNGGGAFDQPVLVYYDAGKQPKAMIGFDVLASVSVHFTLTGYLLDCNLAPCAPIAH